MSKIPTKKEYLNKLRNHPDYVTLIKKVQSNEERKQIVSRVEFFANTMFDAVFSVVGHAQQNPEANQKIMEALKTGDNIIKESSGEPINSGSKG